MDKLIEFLVEKRSGSLSIIIGLILPSVLLIFIWDREGFYEIDFAKLILLASGISSVLFLPNLLLFFICIDLYCLISGKEIVTEVDLSEIKGKLILSCAFAIFCTFIEIMAISCNKIFCINFTSKELIVKLFFIYLSVFLALILIKIIYCGIVNNSIKK